VFVAKGVAGSVAVALGRGVTAGGEAMALTGVLKCVTAGVLLQAVRLRISNTK
jgi:hypothetical protein